MRFFCATVSFFFLTNFGFLSSLYAQHEKPRTKLWYNDNDRGNYYEGLYSLEIGSFPIEPLSFYAQYEPYDNNLEQELNVMFFLPEKGNYFLKAEELYPSQYYWMEDKKRIGEQGVNYFKAWNTTAYLKKLSIAKKNLGVLVRIGSYNSNSFAPAYIYHSNLEEGISKYIAKFRINRTISKGVWKVYSGHYQKKRSNEKIMDVGKIGRMSGGNILTLVFDEAITNSAAGWYTVELLLHVKNSTEKIKDYFTFYHQPSCILQD